MTRAGLLSCWVTLALLCPPGARGQPASTKSCQREFEGGKFLAVAQGRGIAVTSDCNEVDLVANEFHAPPAESCTCAFTSEVWLADGWTFVRIIGEGDFSVAKTDGSLVVTIAPAGGFRVQQVVVEAYVDDCDTKELDVVLR